MWILNWTTVELIVWCPVVWGSTTWWDLSLPNDHWPVSACRAFRCTLHVKIAAQSQSHIPLLARDGRQPAARKADRYHTTAVKESECPLPHSCSKWKIETIHKTIWIPQHKICKSGLEYGSDAHIHETTKCSRRLTCQCCCRGWMPFTKRWTVQQLTRS